MAQKQELFLDEYFEELQSQKLFSVTNRPEYIGPWVENAQLFKTKTKQLTEKSLPKMQFNANKKRAQFMTTLQKQVEVKRKRFRTLIQKQQSVQKIDLDDQSNTRKNNLNQFQVKQLCNTPPFKEVKLQQNKSKIKKALSTTMYIYQCQQTKKLSKQKNSKTSSFAYESIQKTSRKNISEQFQQKQLHNGSKNLQRILKMKQKLRIKNSYLVKKIKDKQINSDQQVQQKYLEQIHFHMPHWNSTMNNSEKRKLKNQLPRTITDRFNHTIFQVPLNIKRTVTSKYFNQFN